MNLSAKDFPAGCPWKRIAECCLFFLSPAYTAFGCRICISQSILFGLPMEKLSELKKNVSPEFNPASPRFYTPTKPIQYVLETNAGFVEAGKIKSGDEVFFYNID